MIVVDIETSGVHPESHGIWQIGALDLENPENTFLEESRIDDEDETMNEALLVTGKTEEELRDKNKQSQKEMLEKFFNWASKIEMKNMLAQGWMDIIFISQKARKYKIANPFPIRLFELHSIAQTIYFKDKGEFLTTKNQQEKPVSNLGLKNILSYCGMKDERKHLDEKGNIEQEGTPHNALEDAKLESECFTRLVYGKPLLPEFSKFPIPNYLKK